MICSKMLWLGLFLLCGTAPLFGADPVRHVVLISVDGLPASMLHDPAIPLDSIRGLASQGVIAAGMTVSNPSVTWPNHTTLMTGVTPREHGVLYNGKMERTGLGLPVQLNSRLDGSALVHAPTLPEALHAAGKSVVGINWPCTRNSSAFLVDFPDTPDSLTYTTEEFLNSMIQEGIVPADIREGFPKLSPAARDRIWTRAACYALNRYRPALTFVHLLNVDALHHRFGPGSWPGVTAVAYADTCVGQILKTLDDSGMRDQTVVLVVSDHGFNSIPKTIHPNVLLKEKGLLTVEGNRIAAATAQTFAEGGISMLFLTRPDTIQEDRKRVIEFFTGQEGIADILTPEQYAELGMPTPEESPQMGDLVLVAKDGYGFSNQFTGTELVTLSEVNVGTHGFLSTNPRMNATFVAAGPRIRTAHQIDLIQNLQVAPTIAELLGVPFPSAQGTVLKEILTDSDSR